MELSVVEVVLMTLEIIVFFMAFSGNIVVIIVIGKYLQKRCITNRFIVNLAVADLLTGLASLSQMLYTVVPSLNENLYTCLLRYQVVILMSVASQLTVTFTTFDRYIAICMPHQYRAIMTPMFANCLIVVSWVYSVALAMLPFLGLNRWERPYECVYQLIIEPWGHLLMALTLWTFSIVTAIMYGLILRKAFAIYRQVIPSQKEISNQVNNDTSTTLNVTSMQSCAKSDRMMSTVRGAKALAAVTLMFSLCWLPYTYFQIRGFADPSYLYSGEWEAAKGVVFLGMANSVMNPIIYAWQRKDFNAACKRLLSFKAPVVLQHRVEYNSLGGGF